MPDFTDSVWTRPARTRGDQPALSREQIVRAAIELLDAEGAAGLSMRRLGTRLGSGATSVYWYVANKDGLLELAVDEVLGEIYVPEPGDTGWRIGLSVFATGMRATLLRHSWVIGLLGTRPTIGPNVMRMADRAVALLTAGGFVGIELSHASSVVSAHVIGSATTETAAAAAGRRTGQAMSAVAEKLEPYLEQAAAEHPHFEQWRKETGIPAGSVFDDAFTFGLERILDGLEMWLARRDR